MTQNSIFEPDGRAVPYIDEGDGPALVLLLERGLEGDAVDSVAHFLAEEGFRVLRIAARAASGAAATTDERIDDALAVMDHVGLEHAWIGGHASGGTVARAFAAQHTDRANGLLLLGVEEGSTPLAEGIPSLIIQASDDEVTPPAIGERLQAAASDRASIVSIDGAGHLFPLTHPIETAGIIEDYLDWD